MKRRVKKIYPVLDFLEIKYYTKKEEDNDK